MTQTERELVSRARAGDTAAFEQLMLDNQDRVYTLCLRMTGNREDALDLFGFATQEELNLFQQLISVSGVGPKAALAILSTGTPDALAMAIITGDEKALTAAPGIGKKIAQRIILELKDKLAKESAATGLDFSGGGNTMNVSAFTSKATEAAQALAVLGYSSTEVSLALKGVDVENLPLEEIIRQSLKKMVK